MKAKEQENLEAKTAICEQIENIDFPALKSFKDWEEKNQPSEQEAIKIIVNNFHAGEIMLLHGNSKTNTNILKEIINQAKNQGYTFASLNDYEE